MDLPDGLVGSRVALRHRVGDRSGRPLYSDAVGELGTDGDALVVATRRGTVRVARAAVVAVRAVPPASPRRASWTAVARIESLCADAWPAPVDEPLGGWRLRGAGGFTARANSALAIGDPGMPVVAAVDVVRRFAAENGIGPRVQAPIGSPWSRAVQAAGWVLDVGHEAGAEVAVLVTDLTQRPEPSGTGAAGLRPDATAEPRLAHPQTPTRVSWGGVVELAERPGRGWWERATGGEPSAAQRAVLDPGDRLRTAFALLRDPAGGVLGALRAAVVQDHLHLSMMEVVPVARRRGVASELLATAAGWGHEHGARWGVLQVALHNTGARALYERLGWVEHHRYHYLVPPPT